MTFKFVKNPYPGLLVGWKFLLSFRKQDWSLEDYPVIVRKQRDASPRLGKTGRWTLLAYNARIVNWTLAGTGDTAADALENLRETFKKVRENRPSMPRPGTRVPLEFASQERIAANSPLADEFLQSVLGVEGAWISDESSLWDFTTEDSLDGCYARIRSLYGVDASDVPHGNLAEIIERIAQSKQKQVEAGGKTLTPDP
jgi:hypothetical protein